MAWITAGGAILGGLLSGAGAKSGAQTQADAASNAAALQKQMFDIQNQQQAPYRTAGYNALNQIGSLGSGTYGILDSSGKPIGTGTGTDYLTHQFTPQDFSAGIDPGYAFRLQQGQMQAQRLANTGGGLLGGNALRGLEDYTQNAASQEYGNAFNRYQTQRGNIYNTLASIAGLGQTSLGQTTNASGYAGANIGNQIAAQGAALGGGQVAMGNAIGSGLNQIGNQMFLSKLLAPKSPTELGPTGNYPTDAYGNVQLYS